METEKQSLRPSPLLLQIQKRQKKEKKPTTRKRRLQKTKGSVSLAAICWWKKANKVFSSDKYTTKKCASKVALIHRTKTTIKCSHADRTVFCLLLHRKTCVGFRAGESQMRFRLGPKPSMYSSTTILRYEWGESNKKGGTYSSKS